MECIWKLSGKDPTGKEKELYNEIFGADKNDPGDVPKQNKVLEEFFAAIP